MEGLLRRLFLVAALTPVFSFVPLFRWSSSSISSASFPAHSTTLSSDRSTSDCVSDFFQANSGSQSRPVDASLAAVRALGHGALQAAKVPRGKDEAWRYTNLKTLFLRPYAPVTSGDTSVALDGAVAAAVKAYADESCVGGCLVFVDGFYQPALSRIAPLPATAVIAALSQLDSATAAAAGVAELLTHVPDTTELPRDSYASDVLTALNSANVCDAAVVHVPAGVHVEGPVQVLFCNTAGPQPRASYPRLLVRLGEGAELQLKQTYATVAADGHTAVDVSTANGTPNEGLAAAGAAAGGERGIMAAALSEENPDKIDEGGAAPAGDDDASSAAAPTFVNANTRVVLARGARMTHLYAQEGGLATRHVEVLTASVPSDSAYDLAVLQVGGRISRINAHVDLIEPRANCSVHGVTLAGPRQSADLHSSITHDAPEAVSRQQQRNIIADRGEAIFKGRIRIPEHAQLTDSDQLCRTIMLGDRARVIAMPTLEITADNVVCSHGASVADLDENSMFYLAARGIDRQEARKLLLSGFILELLTGFPMDKASVTRLTRKVELMNPSNTFGGTSGQTFMSI